MNLRPIAILLLAMLFVPVPAQRIAVLSDIHVVPGNECGRQLALAVEDINAGGFDAVVVNGDLSNEGSDKELANVKRILDGIRHPLFVLPGNHENNWSQSAGRTFVDLWGADRFVSRIDSLVIVGLNCGPYMKMGDGHVKQEDLHWLAYTLDSLSVAGCRVLSFNHYPLLEDLDNCSEYLDVFEDKPVLAHINGHHHAWRLYDVGDGFVSSNLHGVMTRALDMRDGTYGYAIVDVLGDSVCVYEKIIGEPATEKFRFEAEDVVSLKKIRPRPEFSVPEGFEVECIWTDSASIFTRLGIDDSNVYFGNSTGFVRAVDKRSGLLRWSADAGAPLYGRPVPLVDKVAVPTHDGIMFVDKASGRLCRREPSEYSPFVADGLASVADGWYVQGGYKGIERRDVSDGSLVWRYDSIFNYCQASPTVADDDVFFGAWDTNLRCLDLATGALRWVWNNGKANNMLGPGNVVPVVAGDKVFIVAPDRYMTAIDRRTGKTLWRDNSHRYRESIGHSEDYSRIYAKTMDGALVAVDALSPEFKELWSVDLVIGYDHAPCVVVEKDGLVYAGSRRGIVTISRADGSGRVASICLGKGEINGFDIAPFDSNIYVSLVDGKIYRIRYNGR